MRDLPFHGAGRILERSIVQVGQVSQYIIRGEGRRVPVVSNKGTQLVIILQLGLPGLLCVLMGVQDELKAILQPLGFEVIPEFFHGSGVLEQDKGGTGGQGLLLVNMEDIISSEDHIS